MKKLKNSVKAIIISAVAVVCVLAIVLGCVFGLKGKTKPNPNDDNNLGYAKYNELISDINASANQTNEELSYAEFDSVPYTNVSGCNAENLSRLGKNYFCFKDAASNEHFYAYHVNQEGEYVLYNLTAEENQGDEVDEVNKYGFVKEGRTKFEVTDIHGDYVVIKSIKNDGGGFEKFHESLVYFGGDVPVEIYSFGSFDEEAESGESLIQPNGIKIYDNYFIYSVIKYVAENDGQASTTIVAYAPLSKEKITEPTQKEFLIATEFTDLVLDEEASRLQNNDDVYFVVYDNGNIDCRKISNPKKNDNNIVDVRYSYLGGNKYFIEKKKTCTDESCPNRIAEVEGVSYICYEYEIVDASSSNVKISPITLRSGYGKLNVQSVSDSGKFFYVSEQKLEENNLIDNYNNEYYYKNGKLLIEYQSEAEAKILMADKNKFLTTQNLFAVNDNQIKVVMDFSEYETFSIDGINTSTLTFAFREDGYLSRIYNLDGKGVFFRDENSGDTFSNIYPVNGDYAVGVLLDGVEATYYLINLKTSTATIIENFVEDEQMLALLEQGYGIYLVQEGSNYSLYKNATKLYPKTDEDVKITGYTTNGLQNGGVIEFVGGTEKVYTLKVNSNINVWQDYEIVKYEAAPYNGTHTYNINGAASDGVIGTLYVYHQGSNWFNNQDHIYIYTQSGYYIGNMSFTVTFNSSFTYSIKGSVNSSHSGSFTVTSNNSHEGSASVQSVGNSYRVYYNWPQYGDRTYTRGDATSSDQSLSWNSSSSTANTYYGMPHKLYYYANGHGSAPSSKSMVYSLGYSADGSISAIGYTFNGWYTASTGGSKVGTFTCTGDKSVYAHWSENSYSISYDYNGGSSGGSSTTSASYTGNVLVYSPSRTGYTFTGWYISNMSTESYYKYRGSSSPSSSFGYGSSTYSDTGCSSYSYYYYRNLRSTSGTVTFKAQWSANSYSISYSYNGGSSGGSSTTTSYYTSDYQYYITVYRPTRRGYTFTGWYITNMTTNASRYKGSSSGCPDGFASGYSYYTDTACASYSTYYYQNLRTSSGTVNFSAQWSANSYSISYSYNGGSSGGSSTTTGYFDSNVIVYRPTRIGYTFTGWSISGMSTESYYKYRGSSSPSSSFGYGSSTYSDTGCSSYSYYYYINLRSASGTVYFSANWSENSYSISYSYNSGTSGGSSTTSASYTGNVIVYRPTRRGYTFTSWSISGMSTESYYKYRGSSSPSSSFGYGSSSYTDTGCSSYSYYYYRNLRSTSGTVYFSANWSENSYSISYSYNSGTSGGSSTTSAYYTGVVTVYQPSRIGYTFTGWYITNMVSDGTSKYKGSSTSCSTAFGSSSSSYTDTACTSYSKYYYKNLRTTSGTVNFSAQWSANSYTISYSYNGGSSGGNSTTTGYFDSNVTVYRPTRLGYTFTSWYITNMSTESYSKYKGSSSSSVTTAFGSGSSTYTDTGCAGSSTYYYKNLRATSGTVTFTANWSANTYSISYNYNSGTSGGSSSTTGTFDSYITVYRPSRIGYTFTGWAITNMSTESYNKYKGSTSSCSDAFGSGSSSYTDTACAGSSTYYYKNLRATSGTVTFTAQWSENSYSISYDYSSGTSGGSSTTSAKFTGVVTVYRPVRTGYTFTGWTISGMSTSAYDKHKGSTNSCSDAFGNGSASYTDTACANASVYYYRNLNATSGGSVKFTANWSANKYKITYTLSENGNNGSSAPTEATYDVTFTVSNPTRRGYIFNGWYITGMDGVTHTIGSKTTNGTSYTTDASATTFRNLNSTNGATVNFNANWTAITYYISYSWNGGASGGSAPTSAKYDTAFTVSNPTKLGYTFTGWNITNMDSNPHTIGSASNSSTSVTGTKETNFKNLHATNGSTVTFTATWVANTYNLTYQFDGGAAGSGTFPSTATYDLAFYVSNPGVDRLGYHFVGWRITGTTNLTTKYYGTANSVTSSVAAATTSFDVSVNASTTAGMYFKNLQTASAYTVSFTALWAPNVYNIDYDMSFPKGRQSSFGSASVTRSVAYDTAFSVPNPTATGYTFTGWTLSGLSDNCDHFFNSTTFKSTNGTYMNPSNPGEQMQFIADAVAFRNLSSVAGATVKLKSNWKANVYTVTYHYLPSSLNTSTLDSTTINNSINMKTSKTAKITYDQYFTLLRAASAESTETITLPNDVKLVGWVFYQSAQSNTSLANDGGTTFNKLFPQGTEQAYNTENGLYGSDVHAYAIYSFVEIKIQYFGTTNKADINDISKYGKEPLEVNNAVKTYSPIILPATLKGLKVLGYMISSNRIDAGLLNRGSITSMKVGGNVYLANAGTTIFWGYSSTVAYNSQDPTFYLYAIYEIDTYTISFTPNIPTSASTMPDGSIDEMQIESGSTGVLPTQAQTTLRLIGYTISSYTLTDLDSRKTSFTPGQSFNPSNYNTYKDITLTVNFTPIVYKIEYHFEGGQKLSTGSYPATANFDSSIKVSVPIRNGYALTNYYVTGCTINQTRYFGSSESNLTSSTNANDTISRTGSNIVADYFYKNLSSDASTTVHFYAIWTPIEYNVIVNFNDGTTQSLTVKFDDWFNIPTIQRPGYSFASLAFTNMTSTTTHYVEAPTETTFTEASKTISTYATRAKNLADVAGRTVTITVNWTQQVSANSLHFVTPVPSQIAAFSNIVATAVKFW